MKAHDKAGRQAAGNFRDPVAAPVRLSNSWSTFDSMSGRDRLSPSRIHCANAIPNTVAPVCAARVAARLADVSRAQGLGDRCGEACQFVQLAFPERGVLVDHGLPHAGVWAALVGKKRCRRLKRAGDDLERGCVRRRGVHPVDERLEELLLPVEQHLALVAEVPEEGALGQPDGLRDLRGGRLLEPASGEQLECRCLQALSRTRLPPHHGPESSDDSDCRIGVW